MKVAARCGVPVCIAAGVNAVAVAETAICALMLALYKRLCEAHNSLRAGNWLRWELCTGCYELWQKTVAAREIRQYALESKEDLRKIGNGYNLRLSGAL